MRTSRRDVFSPGQKNRKYITVAKRKSFNYFQIRKSGAYFSSHSNVSKYIYYNEFFKSNNKFENISKWTGTYFTPVTVPWSILFHLHFYYLP